MCNIMQPVCKTHRQSPALVQLMPKRLVPSRTVLGLASSLVFGTRSRPVNYTVGPFSAVSSYNPMGVHVSEESEHVHFY